MRNSLIALGILALGVLACEMQVSPANQPLPPQLSPVPSTATAAPEPTVTATEAADTAVVRQVSVNVRNAPGGDPTGEYVYAGQSVTVLEVVKDEQGDEWAKIADPAGYVYAGCLEGINDKGCEAAK
jgi:hypothetical protein